MLGIFLYPGLGRMYYEHMYGGYGTFEMMTVCHPICFRNADRKRVGCKGVRLEESRVTFDPTLGREWVGWSNHVQNLYIQKESNTLQHKGPFRVVLGV